MHNIPKTSLFFTVRRRRRVRSLKIVISEQKKIVVVTGLSTSLHHIERFVASKKDWIEKTILVVSKHKRMSLGDGKSYSMHKYRALRLINERIKKYHAHYQFPYKKISIRNQSTRWGSCSRAGTLSFSYKLLFLPDELIDYIVVHELCHLKEMNHSKRFWVLVKQTLPHCLTLKKELRRYTLS